MSDFLSECAAYFEKYGRPDRFELMLCDINGLWRGKWMPGDSEGKIAEYATRLPMSTYAPNIMGFETAETGLGIVAGDPDGILQTVPGSLRRVPWSKGHAVQVQVEMGEKVGEISYLSTRNILSSMVKRFNDQGLHPVVATELEFYIYPTRPTSESAPVPPPHTPGAQNYELEILTQHEAFLNELQSAAHEQGLPTDGIIAEFGPGQFEINFKHTDDVLFAADTAVLFRRLVRCVAMNHGLEATFAAKPYAQHPGSGMHVHASVLDDVGNNIFTATDGPNDALRAAVSGTLSTMRELQAIFAPHLNSYRRFQKGSFSPAAPDWGLDHRSAAIRLPAVTGPAARLEHRIAGADVNPYLALTAILGGMLSGINSPSELPLPLDDKASKPSPPLEHDWISAVDKLSTSEVAADFFGQAFLEIFIILKRDEIATLTPIISPIEYSTYLDRF